MKPTFKTMTNINISVPESLKSFIDHEIVEGGYSWASEYLQLQLNHFAKTNPSGMCIKTLTFVFSVH